jgi:predicted acylesterase/phospholipase RssA
MKPLYITPTNRFNHNTDHQNDNKNSCNILLLSGGGAYGAYEAGIISRLVENGSRWDYLTGVSAGSINAFFLSSLGYPANLTTILRDSWNSIKSDNVYKIVPTDWLKSLASNEPLTKTMQAKIKEYNLEELQIPVYVGTVSLEDGIFYQWYLDHNTSASVVDLIIASSNIPIVFAPHYFANSYWIDGGTLRNIIIEEPIIKCLESGKTDIHIDMITVNNPVAYESVNKIANWYLWDYAVRTLSLIYQNMGDVELNCTNVDTDIYAYRWKPQTKPYSFLDFSHGGELFDLGYNTLEYSIVKVC